MAQGIYLIMYNYNKRLCCQAISGYNRLGISFSHHKNAAVIIDIEAPSINDDDDEVCVSLCCTA